MNSNFSVEQIKAYASAFETGDAIWCDDEWHEVTTFGLQKQTPIIHLCRGGNPLVVNSNIFDNDLKVNCRVTTLAEYELQGNEKLVWLGDRGVMFGEVFETFIDAHGNVVYENEFGRVVKPVHQEWGVIPKYNRVKTVAGSGDETKGIARVLYERYYDVLQSALHNNIKSALQENNYSLVIELSELAIEMEESK